MPAPKLCSPQKALEALKNGEAIPGNLAEMRNQASLTEFEDTWQSFGCPDCDGHGRGDASKPTLHHVSDTSRLHTIFHAHLCHTPSFIHIFVTHTIFHTQRCHTPSSTHIFVTHHLSHTTSSHTTPSLIDHPPPPLSTLPSPSCCCIPSGDTYDMHLVFWFPWRATFCIPHLGMLLC